MQVHSVNVLLVPRTGDRFQINFSKHCLNFFLADLCPLCSDFMWLTMNFQPFSSICPEFFNLVLSSSGRVQQNGAFPSFHGSLFLIVAIEATFLSLIIYFLCRS